MRWFLLFWLFSTAQAQEQFIPPTPSGWVTDQTDKLTPQEREALGQQAAAIKARTGLVVGVVLLPTIGDYEPYEVATAVGRRWGVAGTGDLGDFTRNLGATMLIVPKGPQSARGRCFIATAKGAEGFITDNRAAAICDGMIPYFRQDQYAAGVQYGLTRVLDLAVKAKAEATRPKPTQSGIPVWIFFVGFGLVGGLVLLLVLAAKRQREAEDRRAQERFRTVRRASPQDWGVRAAPPRAAPPPGPRTPAYEPPKLAPEPPRRRPDPPRRDDDSSSSGGSSGGGFSFGGGSDSYSGGGGGRDW